MKWYRSAAEHGNINVFPEIGIMYEEGYGVKKTRTVLSSITSPVQKKTIAKPSFFWPTLMRRQTAFLMIRIGHCTGTGNLPETAMCLR